MDLSVVCVLKSGGDFKPAYVHRLRDMVKRNLKYSFRMDCLTDYPKSAFDREINVIPFQVDFPWKWCKINLWNPHNPFLNRILYLDLDSVILGDLTEIVDYPADFALVHQWKKNMKSRFGRSRNLTYKSPLMVWNHNARPELWNDFSLGILDRLVGDQDWIGERLPNEQTLPIGWFDEQRYYESEEEIPSECRVLGITDKGKNEQAVKRQSWLQKHWGGPCVDKRSKVTRSLQDKVDIVTFLWGDWGDGLGERYVRTLQKAVEKNLDIPHRFICLSDREIDGIQTYPIYPPSKLGNLVKLAIYNDYYQFNGRVMLMDLDMVVTGSLNEIASYDGEIAARAAFRTREAVWIPDGDMTILNLTSSRQRQIWKYITNSISKIESRTQGAERKFYKQFYTKIFPQIDFIQELFPEQLQSYKQDGVRTSGLPKNARIVSFHGRPKPHQVADKWVLKYWNQK